MENDVLARRCEEVRAQQRDHDDSSETPQLSELFHKNFSIGSLHVIESSNIDMLKNRVKPDVLAARPSRSSQPSAPNASAGSSGDAVMPGAVTTLAGAVEFLIVYSSSQSINQ